MSGSDEGFGDSRSRLSNGKSSSSEAEPVGTYTKVRRRCNKRQGVFTEAVQLILSQEEPAEGMLYVVRQATTINKFVRGKGRRAVVTNTDMPLRHQRYAAETLGRTSGHRGHLHRTSMFQLPSFL